MLSSLGGNVTTQNGLNVRYTIGQQFVIGTKKRNVIVQQGFQQNNRDKIIATNKVPAPQRLLTLR